MHRPSLDTEGMCREPGRLRAPFVRLGASLYPIPANNSIGCSCIGETMRQFSEVTLKVTVEKPNVGETRQLLVQAVDTIHESNYVFDHQVTDIDVPDRKRVVDGKRTD